MLRRFTIKTYNGVSSRYSSLMLGGSGYRSHQVITNQQKHTNIVPYNHLCRTFSSQDPPKDSSSTKKGNEIVLTPGQKVVAGSKSILYLSMLGFAGVCAFYIGKELLPTKMSPNTVFNNATEKLKSNSMIKQRFGDRIKTYGRDHGGTREGRRNFVEHTEYVDAETRSKRTRVRFNLEGPNGNAFVFAEVSNDMPSGEFVYLLVQDKRTGYVITIEDNRTKIAMERMVGGDSKGKEALGNLLGRSN